MNASTKLLSVFAGLAILTLAIFCWLSTGSNETAVTINLQKQSIDMKATGKSITLSDILKEIVKDPQRVQEARAIVKTVLNSYEPSDVSLVAELGNGKYNYREPVPQGLCRLVEDQNPPFAGDTFSTKVQVMSGNQPHRGHAFACSESRLNHLNVMISSEDKRNLFTVRVESYMPCDTQSNAVIGLNREDAKQFFGKVEGIENEKFMAVAVCGFPPVHLPDKT